LGPDIYRQLSEATQGDVSLDLSSGQLQAADLCSDGWNSLLGSVFKLKQEIMIFGVMQGHWFKPIIVPAGAERTGLKQDKCMW